MAGSETNLINIRRPQEAGTKTEILNPKHFWSTRAAQEVNLSLIYSGTLYLSLNHWHAALDGMGAGTRFHLHIAVHRACIYICCVYTCTSVYTDHAA